PYRQRGVRFERRMVLRGRLVGCVDGHVARGERVLDGLDTVGQDGQGRRYLPGRGLRVDGGVDAVGERRGRGPFVVGDLGEGGGVPCLLERLRDDEPDRLAVVAHVLVLQGKPHRTEQRRVHRVQGERFERRVHAEYPG